MLGGDDVLAVRPDESGRSRIGCQLYQLVSNLLNLFESLMEGTSTYLSKIYATGIDIATVIAVATANSAIPTASYLR